MEYKFTSKLWEYNGKGSWYFLNLPSKLTDELKIFRSSNKGFGSIKVRATIGLTKWDASIFPDSKSGSYLLPVKKEVRTINNLVENDLVNCKININLD